VSTGQLVIGPERHGVVQYALRVQRELERARPGSYPLLDAPNAELDGVHVHFTDRLFGSDAAAAADRFCSLATQSASGLSVTLHDVPQESDGRHFGARADAYRRVAVAAKGVVVSSEHERALFGEIPDTPDPAVIPLAVTVPSPPIPFEQSTIHDVAILGYIYPGKGHDEVLRALASVDPDVGFLAVGAPSDGHEDLVTELDRVAAQIDRRFRTTGFVVDDELPALLRSVAVPIAHHRHMSASASITSWIEAGRRPLAPRTRYTAEIDARSPGTIRLFEDTPVALVEAIESALADPQTTWIDAAAQAHPSWDEVAEAYIDVFDRWFG
jgi:glycosyltransferase involved in cell wall biosynthesis